MSFLDKSKPFSMEFEDDDEPGLGFAKPSKNDQIYGIFNPFDDSDPSPPSPSAIFKPTSFNPSEAEAKTKPSYGNFKKSDHILYEPSKTIQVKYAQKAVIENNELNPNIPLGNDPNIEEKSFIKAKRIFDFKNKKTSKIESFDFPKSLGHVHKKVKTEVVTPQTNQEAQKLKEQYGKGYLMAKSLGFEVGKGLGKEKQGILKPLEAVQKTSYNSNFENRLEQNTTKKRKNEPETIEKTDEPADETEKVVKRWKKHNKLSKKRLPAKDLNSDKSFLPDKPLKIIDMRGPEARFLGSMKDNLNTSTSSKTRRFGEFIMILKSDYEGNKHILHDLMRKIRFEEDKKVTNTYEISLLESKSKGLSDDKVFLSKAKAIISTLEGLDLSQIIEAFDEIVGYSHRLTLEFELYLYFLKAFAQKARVSPERSRFRSEITAFLGYFKRIKEILMRLFPQKRIIDAFEPNKEELLSKRPKKLIEQVFRESVWIGIRGFLTNEFSPCGDSEEVIGFLEDWKVVLGLEVLEEVFEGSIRGKLEGEIKEFEPVKARFPIHVWFFQWLPYVKGNCLGLWMKMLQQKFIRAFNQWSPKENNQKFLQMILPWKNIMDNELFEALIKRSVIPKLMFLLQGLVIKPENQDIDPIKYFLPWIPVLSNEEIELLLDKPLIEKLERTLDNWLLRPKAKKDEMLVCLNGWKSYLGELVPRIERISFGFDRMNDKIEKHKEN